MNIETILTTDRLTVRPLETGDHVFILELVNTEDWIKFIGKRDVNSPAEATAYIQKIVDNPNTTFWTVRLKEGSQPIGVISLIKRAYLAHHDIGFAFLPGFYGKGYAVEAAETVLNHLVQAIDLTHILATTIPENVRSIKLLHKLGLRFQEAIEVENEVLHVYERAF